MRPPERLPRPPLRLRLRVLGAGSLLGILVGLLVLVARELPGTLGFSLGGFELGGDQGVILGAQVDLLRVVAGRGALGVLLVADELVLALELLDVANADLELMGDPGIRPALAHPGADLVQMGAK